MVLVATFGLAIPKIPKSKTWQKSLKMLTQQNLATFKSRYLGNGMHDKYSNPYHFLGQVFELFVVVPFIFAFEDSKNW